MRAAQRDRPIAEATVDAEGRLVSADAALEGLHLNAGGVVGGPLAVPPLATVARLARRLGIVVARQVLVGGDDSTDVELVVRAEPAAEGVRLVVTDWTEVAARSGATDIAPVEPDVDWRWETDASLRVSHLTRDGRGGPDRRALLGEPLTALFTLADDAPLLTAPVAEQRTFNEQPARLRDSGANVRLSARVRRNQTGGFAGLIGATRVDRPAPVAPGQSLPASFTSGLDAALRKPLARIVANADSINAQADGPIAHWYTAYAADIASAGRHLLGLVDDLVDLQAIERPDFILTREAIDLADVARRAAGLLSVRATQAEVTIERPAPDMRCAALGDFRRALQIAVNLAGNAVRYSPAAGQVTMAVEAFAGTAALIVTDHGRGIAAKDQLRIFDKFVRVDTSEAGGNGLGLYISRRLARAMGGELTVESAPGAGARFTLRLSA